MSQSLLFLLLNLKKKKKYPPKYRTPMTVCQKQLLVTWKLGIHSRSVRKVQYWNTITLPCRCFLCHHTCTQQLKNVTYACQSCFFLKVSLLLNCKLSSLVRFSSRWSLEVLARGSPQDVKKPLSSVGSLHLELCLSCLPIHDPELRVQN